MPALAKLETVVSPEPNGTYTVIGSYRGREVIRRNEADYIAASLLALQWAHAGVIFK